MRKTGDVSIVNRSIGLIDGPSPLVPARLLDEVPANGNSVGGGGGSSNGSIVMSIKHRSPGSSGTHLRLYATPARSHVSLKFFKLDLSAAMQQ
jgi:hypothetical protein